MISEVMVPATNVEVELRDVRTGEVVGRSRTHNLVVTSGLNLVRDLLANSGRAPNCIALGTGNSATTMAMTALEAEVYRGYMTRRELSSASVRYQLFLDAAIPPGQPYTIQEVGIFSGGSFYGSGTPSTGGTLFARAVLTPFTKDSLVTATITWDIPITKE
jgi:hypothetical protein